MPDKSAEQQTEVSDPLRQLQTLYDKAVNDLNECRKQNKLLIEYKKALIESINNCNCDTNISTKYLFKALEDQFRQVFGDIEEPHETCQRSGDTLSHLADETPDENGVVIAFEEVLDSAETAEANQEVIVNEDNENNENFVLVFNKRSNTIIRKLSDDIDISCEFIINKFVLKKNEETGKEPNCEGGNSKENGSPVTYYVESGDQNSEPTVTEKRIPKQVLLKRTKSPKGQTYIRRVAAKPVAPIKRLNERTTDRFISLTDIKERNDRKSYYQNKKVFGSLIEDLKSGRIENFVDPDFELLLGLYCR